MQTFGDKTATSYTLKKQYVSKAQTAHEKKIIL